MTRKSFHVCAAAVCLAVAASSPARSQGYPPSQRGTVSQNVAFTEIAVTYGRPVARGRESLLDALLDSEFDFPLGIVKFALLANQIGLCLLRFGEFFIALLENFI